jgi:hypothetical protein
MAKNKKSEIDMLAEVEKSYRRITQANKRSPIDDLFIDKPEAALKIWASLAPKRIEAQVEHQLNFVQVAIKAPMPLLLEEEVIDITAEAP